MKIRITNKKLIVVLSIGIISVGALLTTVKINFTYASENDENLRNEDLFGKTITEVLCDSAQEIEKGPSESFGKVAYITIDDGPSKYTDEIIDTLNKYNAKATFFMIDSNMKNYPHQVSRVLENGNAAGLHSVSHDIKKLYKNSTSAKDEFDINKQTFLDITGSTSKIIRLPYGSKPYMPLDSYSKLVEAGYKIWDWDIDTQDWRATSSQIFENVVKYSKEKDNIVILMHEKKQTVEALDSVLKHLKNEGFELIPIKESESPQNYWLQNSK